MPEIKIVRSARKTLALEMRPEGAVLRAPLHASDGEIERFLARHEKWLEKAAARMEERLRETADQPPLTMEELRALAEQALAYIPARAAHYAALLGVSYGRITIRNQRSRWGSCSSRGNLNFNCLLMLTPPEVIDSVVVHELCHRREMNHSERFYAEVLRVFPDYRRHHDWLKEHGAALMRRLP